MAREKDFIAASAEHNSRGIELADRGWFDEAVKEFQKAIELDPNSAHAHENLATVYTEKKQFKLALEEYLTALRLEPEDPVAHYNLACFLSLNAAEFAIEAYRAAIDLDPEYLDAHLDLGVTYADTGQFDEGLKSLKKAVELDPADPLPHHELAALYEDMGDYRSAITHLKEVVRLTPENFDAWLDLGICYAQKGFYAEAERSYEKAQDLKDGDLLLIYNLAALYSLWERPRDAIEHLKQALEIDRSTVVGWMASDAMFDALKGHPEFEALL
jgi:Flp pilus assembly protein TadD